MSVIRKGLEIGGIKEESSNQHQIEEIGSSQSLRIKEEPTEEFDDESIEEFDDESIEEFDDESTTLSPPNDAICLEELDIKFEPLEDVQEDSVSGVGDVNCINQTKELTPLSTNNDSNNDNSSKKPPKSAKLYKCEICEDLLSSRTTLRRHKIAKHSPPGTQLCTSCCKTWKTAEELKSHSLVCKSKRRQFGVPGRFRCAICSKRFTQKSFRDRHQREPHRSDNRFECNICGALFKWKQTLKKHKTVKHNTSGTYPCHLCSKTLLTSTEYEAHLKLCRWKRLCQPHRQPGTYECKICKLVFKTSSLLYKHNKVTHKREKSATNQEDSTKSRTKEIVF